MRYFHLFYLTQTRDKQIFPGRLNITDTRPEVTVELLKKEQADRLDEQYPDRTVAVFPAIEVSKKHFYSNTDAELTVIYR